MTSESHLSPAATDFPPHYLAFYEVSVVENARLAVNSFMAFGECISNGALESEAAAFLQEALGHCAAISRFFWPQRSIGKFADQRGELLRKRYSITEMSPLADRKLRNALEHFDERLDEWILSNPVGPIIASPIVADVTLVDDEIGHVFKLIDPDHDIYVVLGQKFQFGPLAREVSKILAPDIEQLKSRP